MKYNGTSSWDKWTTRSQITTECGLCVWSNGQHVRGL